MPLWDCYFFFPGRRRHTRCLSDWSSDVCSSDLVTEAADAVVGSELPAEAAEEAGARAAAACAPITDARGTAEYRRQEIGRASCRESVEVSVRAQAASKKTCAPDTTRIATNKSEY